MLGNDIIDVAHTKQHTDWTRTGWLDKVCTPREQNIIHASQDPFSTVWRIWSMKESAYKIYIQQGREHSFNPTHFQTQFINSTDGKVRFADEVVDTVSNIERDYIHTIGSDRVDYLSFNHTGFTSNSIELKKLLLTKISERFSYDLLDLEIRSGSNRAPLIYIDNNPLHLSLSLSHHGRFGAYTFCKHA